MQKFILFSILVITIGTAHLSVSACSCMGVNPEIYPPDIPKSRIYYRGEFKGAAFTGKVLSTKEAIGLTRVGENIQELTFALFAHNRRPLACVKYEKQYFMSVWSV